MPIKVVEKPVVLEAVQWSGENAEEISALIPKVEVISCPDGTLFVGGYRAEPSGWLTISESGRVRIYSNADFTDRFNFVALDGGTMPVGPVEPETPEPGGAKVIALFDK